MQKSVEWRNGYAVAKAGGQPCDMPITIYERSQQAASDWMSGFLIGARDKHSDDIIDAFERVS